MITIASRIEEYTNAALSAYISSTVSNICGAIAPIAVAGTTIYILLFSYNMAMGHVQSPAGTSIKRGITIAFIGSLALSAGIYNSYVVSFFFGLRDGLVSAINPRYSSLGEAIDNMGEPFLDLVQAFIHQSTANGNPLGIPDFNYWLAAGIVLIAWIIFFAIGIGLYIVALVGLGLCLGIGPLFIMLALWPATSSYTERWLAQVVSFCILTMLISAVISIFGSMLQQFAQQTAVTAGDTANIAEAGCLLFMAIGLFMVLLQLDRLASALTGGIGLGSAHGTAMGVGGATATAGAAVGRSLRKRFPSSNSTNSVEEK